MYECVCVCVCVCVCFAFIGDNTMAVGCVRVPMFYVCVCVSE